MAEQTALQARRPVGAGTLGFAVGCLVLSLSLVVLNGIGTGVGASGVRMSRSHGSAVHVHTTVVSINRHFSSRYPGDNDVPLRPKPKLPEIATPAASPAPPTASQVATTPAPAPPPPPPPPPAPAALPGRGAATAYGCAAALAYLASYSAPGFTFQCPGGALGHQAMTCINEPGVCANENLIAIADPCPAAYMNEASNSWVLTGASDAPIDPYGACH